MRGSAKVLERAARTATTNCDLTTPQEVSADSETFLRMSSKKPPNSLLSKICWRFWGKRTSDGKILGQEDFRWKGPSWSTFFHAVYNQRPVSVITARGHHPETIKDGINTLLQFGHIPTTPNFHGIYPVSHPETKVLLGEENASIARLKQLAIRHTVEEAFRLYGHNPNHRFGMSDDDPHNIELMLEEMILLKKDYPEVAFFLIETHADQHFKYEVHPNHVNKQSLGDHQLAFF
jgi:hypothetical protein